MVNGKHNQCLFFTKRTLTMSSHFNKKSQLNSLLVFACLLLCIGFSQFACSQHLLWKFSTGRPLVGSLVQDGDKIYFGGLDSIFYALDISTGSLRWKLKTDGAFRSAPVVVNGNIFVYNSEGKLYCIRPTGTVAWTFRTGGEKTHEPFGFADYFLSSPVYENGLLFFGSGDSCVYAIGVSDGQLRWRYKTGDVVHATPCLYQNRLYIGSFDGWFYCLAKDRGTLQWKFKSIGQEYFPKGEFNGSATAFNNAVFVGARDYNFYALNASQPSCRWNLRFPKGWAITRPLIHDSLLYIGTSDDRKFFCLDPKTGGTIWTFDAKYNLFGAPVVADSVIYEGTMMGHLFGLHKKTGKLLFDFTTDGYNTHHLDYFKEDDTYRDDVFKTRIRRNEDFLTLYIALGGIISQPIVFGNCVLFTSMDGNVYCITR